MSLMEDHIFSAGYVLIRAATGADPFRVRDELSNLDVVRIAHTLEGPDNLICYIESYNPHSFRTMLNKGIRRLIDSGLIEHTETLVILSEKGKGYTGKENSPMPASAWLLCDVSVNDPETVIVELRTKKGFVNAHPVLGRYDMVAYFAAASMGELRRILDQDIPQIKGIRTIDTRLVSVWNNPANESSHRDGDNQKHLGVPTP